MVKAKGRKEKTGRMPTPGIAEPIEETIEGETIIEEPAVTGLGEKRTEEKKAGGEKPEVKTGEKKPGDRNDSIEISNKLIAAVVIIVVLVAAALYVWPKMFPEQKPPERQVNKTLESMVAGIEMVSVIMNTTGASENGSRAVMQCGVEISGTMARLGKNVSNYVFDGGTCVTPEVKEVPVSECSKATKNIYETICCFIGICAPVSECSKATDRFYFVVSYGPNVTRFYDRHVEVEVNEQFGRECLRVRSYNES